MSPNFPLEVIQLLRHVNSLRNNGLEVEPGEARVISSVTLLAQDGDTPSSEVQFILESVPKQGLLQLKVGPESGCNDELCFI